MMSQSVTMSFWYHTGCGLSAVCKPFARMHSKMVDEYTIVTFIEENWYWNSLPTRPHQDVKSIMPTLSQVAQFFSRLLMQFSELIYMINQFLCFEPVPTHTIPFSEYNMREFRPHFCTN